MRDIAKQLVQLTNRLLDVANFRLTLDDERLLKVDLVLVGQT